jgi:hypothetical protein
MRVTRLAGAAALVALLAAGCAGEPTGAQVEVQGVTSTAADTAAITEPARTQRTATTRRASATTRPTTASKPAAKPELTVSVETDAVEAVEIRVVGQAPSRCPPDCSYRFRVGEQITLTAIVDGASRLAWGWAPTGGETTCVGSVQECTLTLTSNTTVRVTSGDTDPTSAPGEEGGG